MTRPPTRRAVLTAGLTAALLAGCGAPGLPGSGGDTGTAGAAVSEQQAVDILRRVLAEDDAVRSGVPGAAGKVASTYAGEGLRAAQAAVQLIAAGVQKKATGEPVDVKVLATSRGTAYPRHILGASTPAPGRLPTIQLLVATNSSVPYRFALGAQMLPGATISAFPAADEGAQVVTDGADMIIKPTELLTAYAQGLTKAQTGDEPYESDVFLEQVRAASEKTRREIAALADFRQTNQVMRDPVVALRDLDGDTLVLGAIERTSDYAVKAGQQVPPSAIFSAFVPGRSALVQQIRVQVIQFVVFTVPRQGKAHLVAATEQVVGASGY